MASKKDSWKSITYLGAVDLSKAARNALDRLGYTYVRERSEKAYDKLVVVMPMIQRAYVFQFKILKPEPFIINVFDTKPTPSADLHHIELEGLNKQSGPHARMFLKELAKDLPDKPWKVPMKQKFRYAIMAPEYMRARDQWNAMGVL